MSKLHHVPRYWRGRLRLMHRVGEEPAQHGFALLDDQNIVTGLR
jgi:hypothetical protein